MNSRLYMGELQLGCFYAKEVGIRYHELQRDSIEHGEYYLLLGYGRTAPHNSSCQKLSLPLKLNKDCRLNYVLEQ